MGKELVGLFCFDGPLYKDKDGIYCNLTLTNEMFSRYFRVVDKLIVFVRTFYLNKTYVETHMKPLQLDNLEIVEVPNFSSVRGYFLRYTFKSRIIEVLNKSTYIFARMPSVTSNEVLKYALKYKRKYLAEVGGCAWDSYWNHGFLGKLIAPLMFYNEKKYVYNADYCSYVTKFFLQKRYPNKNPENTTYCSNVYLDDVSSDVLENRIHKIENADLSCLVFGQAVNSIDVKYKGEDRIIKILASLNKLGIRAIFQIAGPGKGKYLEKVALKYNVLNQVRFLGPLSKSELFEWYQKIDLYVQPSLQEGLPRSVIEAMSYSCPVIGSRVAGIPELLNDDFMFNPRSKKELLKTLIRIINKPALINNATCSFLTSKSYSLKTIQKRRNMLFDKYKESINLAK